MLSRRGFLIGATALTMLPSAARAGAMAFGLQLYSVGDDLKRDFDGTLKHIAAMGYTEVELADTFGKSAEVLGQAFDAARLNCVSAHFSVEQLEKHLDQTIGFAQNLSLSYMVCAFPRLADVHHPTHDEWMWHAEFFNRVGTRIKDAGLQFAHHNHNLEFTRYGARTGYEDLLAHTDANLVKLELDCGWAAAAGLDPAQLLAQHPNRFRLLHVKDVKKGSTPNTDLQIETTDIGAGALDWRKILAAGQAAGVTNYFVELEPPSTPAPLDAAKKSLGFLTKLSF